MKEAFFNWSGGKDSALALYYVLKEKKYNIDTLLTTVNSRYNRISMHGVREELLELQAKAIGLPLQKLYMPEFSDMNTYDTILNKKLAEYRSKDIEYAFFGDIFLEDLRTYRENQLARLDLLACFPLWKRDTTELINEFIDLGFKTIVTCISEKHLSKEFAGRIIDKDFVKDLPSGVDPCGENGEFHTFVFDGPVFRQPVYFKPGEKTYRKYENDDQEMSNGFWYCDLLLK